MYQYCRDFFRTAMSEQGFSCLLDMISHNVKFKFVYHYLDDRLYSDMKVESQNCVAGRDIIAMEKLSNHFSTATESRHAATVSTQQ
jgi:hypothetical protein